MDKVNNSRDEQRFYKLKLDYFSAQGKGELLYLDATDYLDLAEDLLEDLSCSTEFVLEVINDALLIHPQNEELKLKKAYVLHLSLLYDEALEVLDGLNQFALPVIRLKAKVMFWSRSFVESKEWIEFYKDIVKPRQWELLCYDYLFEAQEEGGNAEDILLFLNEHFVLEEVKNHELIYLWGVSYFYAREPQKAMRALLYLRDLTPYDADVWYMIAKIQASEFEFSEARNNIEYALAIDAKHAESYVVLAMCDIYQGRCEDGHMHIDKYANLSMNKGTVAQLRGNCFVQQGKIEEAIEAFELAMFYEPNSFETLSLLVSCYIEMRYFEKAESYISLGEIRFSDELNQFHMLRAEMYYQKGCYAAALNSLSKYEDSSLFDYEASLLNAIIYTRLHNYTEAKMNFKVAIESFMMSKGISSESSQTAPIHEIYRELALKAGDNLDDYINALYVLHCTGKVMTDAEVYDRHTFIALHMVDSRYVKPDILHEALDNLYDLIEKKYTNN